MKCGFFLTIWTRVGQFGAARPEDIMLLRSLLEGTRKLERQLEHRGIDLHSIVFIRNDIYQHLLQEPADRGKIRQFF